MKDAARLKCPALVQICERDSVAPVAATETAVARMTKAEVVRYPVGHFDVYTGPAFERSVSDQVVFLRKHLMEQPEGSRSSPGSQRHAELPERE